MNYRTLVIAVFAAGIATAVPALAQSQSTPAPAATSADTYVTIPPALPPLIKYVHYVSGGYQIPATVCNAFTYVGNCAVGDRYKSAFARAALEFPIAGNTLTGMVGVDYRRYGYYHYLGDAVPAIPGGSGFAFVPSGQLHEDDFDVRAGIRALEPRLYLGVSYLQRAANDGYPRLRGYGIGLEKLADTDQTFSLYGSYYYYPELRGSFASGGTHYDLAYHVVRYDVGLTLKASNPSPVFLTAGYMGDQSRNAGNAPLTQLVRRGPYVGIGLTF